jgi:hypothetical protein
LIYGFHFLVLGVLNLRLRLYLVFLFYFYFLLGDFKRYVLRADLVRPIIDVIHLNFVVFPGLANKMLQVFVIWFFLELQSFSVVDELCQLTRKPFA